jgi:uncharacterized protein YqjF (DUF2071 family)
MSNSVFLSAEWRKLAIANYSISPEILRKYIPIGTELDLWNNQCYVSLVGFRFLNTKVKGIKIPFHINFEEVNLRFYVKHYHNGEWRRGVVFIKEIVPKRMISFVANTLYKEKYHTMKMRHDWNEDERQLTVKYEWKKDNWQSFFMNCDNEIQPIAIGSEEEFITEHYWGYTQLSDTKTAQYEVKHPRWKVYPVVNYQIKVDFASVYGHDFEILNNLKPVSVMLAEGSEIQVMKGENIINVH